MENLLLQLKAELRGVANSEKASVLARFFKTGKGEYAEGDRFLGISVPEQRKLAKKYAGLTLSDTGRLLASRIHEERLVALFILMHRYGKADQAGKEEAVGFYLKNTRFINNWDLIDLSSGNILGDFLLTRNREVLYRLAASPSLWERRIAVMATFAFIKRSDFSDTLKISRLLLKDPHDLIHKAVGWMLREVGKRDQKTEEDFLDRHAHEMPRTMLRYAVERFAEEKRKDYLGKKGKVIRD